MNPAYYIMADIITDLRQVQLKQLQPNRVLVTGARGVKPTPWLKCCGIFIDGFTASGALVIAGDEAKEKVYIYIYILFFFKYLKVLIFSMLLLFIYLIGHYHW